MEALTIGGILVGIVVFIAGIIAIVIYLDKKRREALGGFAEEMGLDFQPKGDAEMQSQFSRFGLFNSGHSKKIKNVIRGETDVATITMFDYQYTVGHGKHQHTHKQTVVTMESNDLQIPSFTMRPEGLFDKLGGILGFQDIDFEEHPEFSKMFVLKGENEVAIREFFDLPLLDFFASRKGIAFECQPGIFIYYRGGRTAKVPALKDFLNEGYTVYSTFLERLERN